MTIYTQGTWTAKPGAADAFVAAWTDFAVWSKTAYPTLQPLLLRDRDEPNRFVSLGPWPTREMIEDWRASEEFQAHIAVIREHVEGFTVSLLELVLDVQ